LYENKFSERNKPNNNNNTQTTSKNNDSRRNKGNENQHYYPTAIPSYTNNQSHPQAQHHQQLHQEFRQNLNQGRTQNPNTKQKKVLLVLINLSKDNAKVLAGNSKWIQVKIFIKQPRTPK